ncbi:MAG: protease inhibitor I42 family protein [Nitrospirota bacterium]|nr:protease inhibitor I42 family protein [Nitrospirota bacterium]
MAVERSDTKVIVATKGKPFSVRLWEDRTRGEQWVPSYDSSVLVMISDDFLRTTSNNAVDSGSRTFEFEALQVGTHQIEFQKRLAWKFTAEDRRIFVVNVQDSSTV